MKYESILVVVLSPFCLAAIIASYQLIIIEYKRHKGQWIADGKPFTKGWKPKEEYSIGSIFASGRLLMIWLFKTPNWIKNDEEAFLWLKVLRLGVAVWNGGLIIALIVYLVLK